LAGCLEKKPEERISIKLMLELTWVTKTDDELEDDIKKLLENNGKPHL
jgi:hypothetical protein